MKKLLPMNQLLNQMTKPLIGLVKGNGLTRGEVLNLVFRYLEVHCPENQEKYIGGGSPVFYYQTSTRTHVVPISTKTKAMGDLLLDLESAILPMSHNHDLQWYEILSLVDMKIQSKCSEAIEKNSKWYYGPKEGLAKFKRQK
jgi:hypothetical protein